MLAIFYNSKFAKTILNQITITFTYHIQDSLYQAPPSSNPTSNTSISSTKSVIIIEGNENIEDNTSNTEESIFLMLLVC